MSYVELHTHSCFSLLDGASTPEALVERAALMGMPALALTDHDAVYGAVRFVSAAREMGIRPILGAELTLHDETHLTLLAADAAGWANLCALITLARMSTPKGEARLPSDDALLAHTDGLIALSGCRQSRVARALRTGDRARAEREAQRLRAAFGRDRFFLELHHHQLPDDARCILAAAALADRLDVGVVAANNVHYAERDGHLLQDVLVCIRHLTTLDEAPHLLRPNSEFYLKSAEEMAALFVARPDALANTLRIASMCDFQLEFGLQDLPEYPVPDERGAHAYLTDLCQAWVEEWAWRVNGPTEGEAQRTRSSAGGGGGGDNGRTALRGDDLRDICDEGDTTIDERTRSSASLRGEGGKGEGGGDNGRATPSRDNPWVVRDEGDTTTIDGRTRSSASLRGGATYPVATPDDPLAAQLAHELEIIERAGLSNYFLIVWDIVRFARQHGIRCQGRGSAANSLVAYALGISPINPLEHRLVFERFLSDERRTAPDIDIDFDAARREEVIQYVYERYGRDHAAMACTFITFRARSALRDVGRALGLPPEILQEAAEHPAYDPFAEVKSFAPRSHIDLDGRASHETWALLTHLCSQIDGFPRHLGIHNGGMIITGSPIHRRLPTEPATMADRSVVQWDKEALEDAGLVKIDLLGLRMLSAVSEAASMVGADLDALPFDDPAIYEMVSAADTIGVFQVESRAQQQVLPRMQPRLFNDLIISISLIRPGPIQGNMVHPYLRRRLGEETVRYPHPDLEAALAETLGVILFQEQVIKTARDLAGFTPGQGELLRRALGSKRHAEAVEKLHDIFVEGAIERGVEQATADAVFDTLRAFGGYSFPKSHAAAFAVLVYQSAWLKRYHPAEFFCGLLNNQPMGFWSPAVIVGDARRHGIRLLPAHVNHSAARSLVVDGAIRIGLMTVRGIGEAAAACILDLRAREGAYLNLRDFCQRTELPKRLAENLIAAGAFDGWGRSRRALLWELGTIDERPDTLPFLASEAAPALPTASALDVLGAEYMMMGLTLGDHPMATQRAVLHAQGILGSRELMALRDGQRVEAAGMVVVHQAPPTAKGMHFITLEDEDGFINAVVRPHIYAEFRGAIRGSAFLIAEGVIERRGGVVNLVVSAFRPLRLKG
ncbi:MAG: DNA polymerase III subunit alpha [Chloroflexi bacterium]|nr:DNA polymerase III subunit alpha [Chloroflexota bacterium]